MNASIPSVDALALSRTKKGYVIANQKNLEKLLTLPFISVKSEHFNGMVDGLLPVDATIEEAKKTARNIIAAKRFGRGIAVYGPEVSTRGLPSVSIGDCCYDVTFHLPA